MKKTKSPSRLSKSFSSFIGRFHLMIFFVAVVGCLIGAVVLINQSLSDSESESASYTSSISAGSIDQTTLQRLQALQPSTEPGTAFQLPAGRVNPFGE